jgi:hypothetical protein
VLEVDLAVYSETSSLYEGGVEPVASVSADGELREPNCSPQLNILCFLTLANITFIFLF